MDEEIPDSEDHKIPKFLQVTFLIILVWGVWALIAYRNGSHGWLDRGYWQQLQEAANTTFPFEKKEPYSPPSPSVSLSESEPVL